MKPEISEKGILNLGRHVLLEEAKELEAIAGRLDETFVKAVTLILNCKGRVVVSGVGKSGHIARKIAATMASTGSPAFFVHAAEAAHGDLGMITKDDVGRYLMQLLPNRRDICSIRSDIWRLLICRNKRRRNGANNTATRDFTHFSYRWGRCLLWWQEIVWLHRKYIIQVWRLTG